MYTTSPFFPIIVGALLPRAGLIISFRASLFEIHSWRRRNGTFAGAWDV